MFGGRGRHRVVVTGVGVVSPLGTTVKDTWSALLRGESACAALSSAPFFFPASIETDRSLSPAAKENFRSKLLQRLPCQVAAPVRWPGRGCCAGILRDSEHENAPTTGGDAATEAKQRGFLSFAPTSHLPRSCQFSHVAVEEALWDARLLKKKKKSSSSGEAAAGGSKAKSVWALDVMDLDRVGVHIGVGIPSVADVGDVSHALFGSPATGEVRYNQVHPFFVTKILGNTPTAMTSIEYGITGPSGSSVAACATGAYSIGEGAAWIQSGRADVVICGSTEACITPVAVAGFSRMRALSATFNATPALASRPFDTQRAGFVMGEGAGIVVLESEDHARERGLRVEDIYGEVRGYGLSSDAHHVAAPDPSSRGAARCIRLALEDGGNVPPSAVQYVNAHATGTIGDPLELTAIQQALRPRDEDDWQRASTAELNTDPRVEGPRRQHSPAHSSSSSSPPLWVSSSKGGIGHLLGAAGSVEAIISLLALKHQLAPPNIHLKQPCWSTAEQTEKSVFLVPSPPPCSSSSSSSLSCSSSSASSASLAEKSGNESNEQDCVEGGHHSSGARAQTGRASRDAALLSHSNVALSKCEAVMSTSFGFGGMNSALLFTKYAG